MLKHPGRSDDLELSTNQQKLTIRFLDQMVGGKTLAEILLALVQMENCPEISGWEPGATLISSRTKGNLFLRPRVAPDATAVAITQSALSQKCPRPIAPGQTWFSATSSRAKCAPSPSAAAGARLANGSGQDSSPATRASLQLPAFAPLASARPPQSAPSNGTF